MSKEDPIVRSIKRMSRCDAIRSLALLQDMMEDDLGSDDDAKSVKGFKQVRELPAVGSTVSVLHRWGFSKDYTTKLCHVISHSNDARCIVAPLDGSGRADVGLMFVSETISSRIASSVKRNECP